MMRRTRTAAVAATAVALAMGMTACGGSSTKSTGSAGTSASGAVTKGGTLYVLNKADFDHTDPQRTYTTEGSSIDQLLVRSLTGWDETGKTNKLVGDLATDTGTPSTDDKTWTFHLRPGVKWQDGSTVTSQDVKYGVERSFSSDISGGPTYAQSLLVGGDKYKGPFSGASLASIETPDASTIVFHLVQPAADFNETTAMPTWSAVPKAHDTGANYDTGVWSDSNYQIQSYTKNKQLVLVPNKNWSQSTDPLRQQNVDKIVVNFGQDESAIDQQLVANSGTAQDSIQEWPIAGADLTTENSNPALKGRYYKIPAPGINYLALNTTRIKDINVRKAIEFAIDKTTVRGAFGGSAYGDYATTMLNPGMDGYTKFNLYSADPAGDPAQAKSFMAKAGNPKLTLSLAVENTPTEENFGSAVKASLAKIGITVNITPIDAANYFSTLANTKNQYDMSWEDWIADWPNASTVLPVLFGGGQITSAPQSNWDSSYLNDPAINSALQAATVETDPTKRNAEWDALDKQILDQAAVVPLMYMNFSDLGGSKVGGIIEDTNLAEPSLVHVYIKK
jgi:peptide/nickel transport system substrate-binding protein